MSSPSSSKGKNLADDTCGAYAGAEQSEILEGSSDPSSSEGKKLADDTSGAYAGAEQSEILEGSSDPSSSEGKKLADDTCGAYAGAEESEILEGSSDSSSSEGKKLADDTCEDGHVPFDDHIRFSSEDEDEWVSKMIKQSLCMPERLKPSSGSKSCSIHRVPYSLRKHNEDAYNPQLISIGPFHYKKSETDQLRSMEEHKWSYLHDIISRTHPHWLEDCYAKIKSSEKRARNCYSEEIPVNSKDFDFIEMMVLDGCFIVEFLRRFWLCSCKDRIFPNDVIIQLAWPARALWCDLLLMENQIPFFILQDLSDLIDADLQDTDSEVHRAEFPPLLKMALFFIFRGNSTKVVNIDTSETLHLLHLLYVGCVPQHTTVDINPSAQEKKNRKNMRPRIPCASKLEQAGIGFKRMDGSDSLGIRFHKGVIEIPRIPVSDFTKKEFLNLIAFEQCYRPCSKLITNFSTFMDSLIDTAKDVEILHDKEIICNDLGDDRLVASEFCSIAREESITYDPHYLTDVCAEINEYSSRFWPRSRASFVHDYFKNPWALVSVIAGLLLLMFAFTQTFFTSFPKFAYKNDHSP